jgi:hypothetical protein
MKTKKMLVFVSFGMIATGTGVLAYRIFKNRKAKSSENSPKSEVKYVFFSTEGKPVVLTERDVYDIKQLQEDGVLNSVIGEEFNMSPVMVSRVINSIKAL